MNLEAVMAVVEDRVRRVTEWEAHLDASVFVGEVKGWTFIVDTAEMKAIYDGAVFVITGPIAAMALKEARG